MEIQKEVIEKILKNDLNGVRDILSVNDLKPDFCDEHGMTPLQHAAYKGNKEMVRLLLNQGAEVNSGKHEYGYTALHFAALSGNTEVCQLLLEYGAKTHATNSVGRTPSQMAAFVGNHTCVTVMNNFVPKSDVEYYTVPSGFETEPKLPALVATPLHKFIMQVNLNPVRIAINLNKTPILYENIEKVKNVLDLMSQKEIKKGFETNEIMSFKFHYLSGILGEIMKCKKALEQQDNQGSEENANKKPISAIDFFIKKMLKVNKGNVSEYQESVLKEIIKEFPKRDCTIFRQMVCVLTGAESPGALSVITSIVNGQKGFDDENTTSCATCGEEKASKKCSQCKSVQYCDRDCQKYHWFVHKKNCIPVSNSEGKETEAERLKKEAETEKLKKEAVNAATESLMSEIKNLKA